MSVREERNVYRLVYEMARRLSWKLRWEMLAIVVLVMSMVAGGSGSSGGVGDAFGERTKIWATLTIYGWFVYSSLGYVYLLLLLLSSSYSSSFFVLFLLLLILLFFLLLPLLSERMHAWDRHARSDRFSFRSSCAFCQWLSRTSSLWKIESIVYGNDVSRSTTIYGDSVLTLDAPSRCTFIFAYPRSRQKEKGVGEK